MKQSISSSMWYAWKMKTCSVKNCELALIARGYCNAHYIRFKKHGDIREDEKVTKSSFDSRNPNWRGGKSKHPLIEIYRDMVARCKNRNHLRYDNYGGRGINVHPEWVEDFWVFVRDVGERPEGVGPTGRALYSLDRINNDGNYEPGNVRWATHSEQARNKRGYGDFEKRRNTETGRFESS